MLSLQPIYERIFLFRLRKLLKKYGYDRNQIDDVVTFARTIRRAEALL
jgi:hypothetical protein